MAIRSHWKMNGAKALS